MSNGQVQVGNFPFGGGGASSVTNADGTLTISPTTGAVVASLNVAHGNTWTANQTFNNSASGGSLVGSAGTLAALTGFVLGKNIFTGGNDIDLVMNTFSGNANVTWSCNALSAIYAGPTTGAALLVFGSTQAAGLGFTDTAIGDSLVSAPAGQTVRIGIGAAQTGTVASTVQVVAAGITVAGTTTTTGIKNNSAQTTVNGSTAGSIICSMPEQGTTYKVVVIFMAAMNGTAVYTFPTVFVHAPSVTGQFSGVTATPTTTNVTVTNTSALSGSLLIYGY